MVKEVQVLFEMVVLDMKNLRDGDVEEQKDLQKWLWMVCGDGLEKLVRQWDSGKVREPEGDE